MFVIKCILYAWITLSAIAVIWFAWEAKHAIDFDDLDKDNEAI